MTTITDEYIGQEEQEEEVVRRVVLNVPQAKFLSLEQKFKAFVSGYGGGKTWVGCSSLGKHFMEHPRINAGYFAPTYPQIRDIFYQTVEEALYSWGFDVKINSSNKEVQLYQGGIFYGVIICRSMDHPETIVGFKIGQAMVDEIDVMKPEKALAAWRKIIARMRYNGRDIKNGIDVTTTPEGFRFVYQQFKEQVVKKPELAKFYGLVQASTYDNRKNLPVDYIPSLLASYPPQLISAYINGQFINLQTGTIYNSYDPIKNDCLDIMNDREPLYIGMDFNVGKMAALVHVLRDGLPRAVDEIINAYDTPDMIKKLKERYWKYHISDYIPSHTISIYPDASGASRKSVDATATDIKLLHEAGFRVMVNRANPPVKDRINSMNAMFCNAAGVRRYLVNKQMCPTYSSTLLQQAWGPNGEPDKTTGQDHPNDAAGYFIQKDFGIKSKIVTSQDMF